MGIRSVGDSLTNIKHSSTATIQLRITDFNFSLEFCVIGHISYQIDSAIDISSWNLPTNTLFSDNGFHESRRIDLLLASKASTIRLPLGK